ncbi:hypothetical protein Ddc_07317 [Ditylenchus destructor]|nr:hypothetical protein Ddc_07317 [Ditylenchus destructor]
MSQFSKCLLWTALVQNGHEMNDTFDVPHNDCDIYFRIEANSNVTRLHFPQREHHLLAQAAEKRVSDDTHSAHLSNKRPSPHQICI